LVTVSVAMRLGALPALVRMLVVVVVGVHMLVVQRVVIVLQDLAVRGGPQEGGCAERPERDEAEGQERHRQAGDGA
jgi:hypothetical protein